MPEEKTSLRDVEIVVDKPVVATTSVDMDVTEVDGTPEEVTPAVPLCIDTPEHAYHGSDPCPTLN